MQKREAPPPPSSSSSSSSSRAIPMVDVEEGGMGRGEEDCPIGRHRRRRRSDETMAMPPLSSPSRCKVVALDISDVIAIPDSHVSCDRIGDEAARRTARMVASMKIVRGSERGRFYIILSVKDISVGTGIVRMDEVQLGVTCTCVAARIDVGASYQFIVHSVSPDRVVLDLEDRRVHATSVARPTFPQFVVNPVIIPSVRESARFFSPFPLPFIFLSARLIFSIPIPFRNKKRRTTE